MSLVDGLTAEKALAAVQKPRLTIPLAQWSRWSRVDFLNLEEAMNRMHRLYDARFSIGREENREMAIVRLRASLLAFHKACTSANRASSRKCTAELQRAVVKYPLDYDSLMAISGRIQMWSEKRREFESGEIIGKGAYAKASFLKRPSSTTRGKKIGNTSLQALPSRAREEESACPFQNPKDPGSFHVVVKTNLKKAGIDDQIHQALLMLEVTNPTRMHIPNFNFIYNVNDCAPTGTSNDLFLCSDEFGKNASKNVNIFSEFANHGNAYDGKMKSLNDMIVNGSFENFMCGMMQALCACSHLSQMNSRGKNKVLFSHNDLHLNNILMHVADMRAEYSLDDGSRIRITAPFVAMIIDFGMSYAANALDGRASDNALLGEIPYLGVTRFRKNSAYDIVRVLISALGAVKTGDKIFERHALAYLSAVFFPWLLASKSRHPIHNPLPRRVRLDRMDHQKQVIREVILAEDFLIYCNELAKKFSVLPPGHDARVGEFISLVMRTFELPWAKYL